MHELVQNVINGASLGSTYALLALGLALVYSIMGLINFAHGELFTIGGYTMWWTLKHGVPWPLVLVITPLVCAIAAMFFQVLPPKTAFSGTTIMSPGPICDESTPPDHRPPCWPLVTEPSARTMKIPPLFAS